MKITVKTPINIALIKYWGKQDEDLIIPCNSSISATLSTEKLFTITTISFQATSSSQLQDEFHLNGNPHPIGKRMEKCIERMRNLAKDSFPQCLQPISIHSSNSFPTAAGLASSASGLSAICLALWHLFRLKGRLSPQDLSCIARMASGSACRSLFGGFVEWNCGSLQEPNSSFAFKLAPSFGENEKLWILIYPFSSQPKSISSTDAMSRTKRTSTLFSHRISQVVPQRLKELRQAIMEKDFSMFFRCIMQDSNCFHATCLDSYPPIHYLNDKSWQLIDAVHAFNGAEGNEKAAYSFDAGANGFVFVQRLQEWLEFGGGKEIASVAPIITKMMSEEEEIELWNVQVQD